MSLEERRKMILVVDDDPKQLELLGVKMSQKGYRLVTAESGEQALKTIEIEKPGLVLLDMMMPGMNGREVLKRIKSVDANIPVCMVTSVWDEEDARKCFEAGAYEYITKPIDFKRLELAVLFKLFPGE